MSLDCLYHQAKERRLEAGAAIGSRLSGCHDWENGRIIMTQKTLRLAAVLLASAAATQALAQDDSVTVALSEELDVVEPCMASRSNIGRVVLQNISETMTELVPGSGRQPRLRCRERAWCGTGEDRNQARGSLRLPHRSELSAGLGRAHRLVPRDG